MVDLQRDRQKIDMTMDEKIDVVRHLCAAVEMNALTSEAFWESRRVVLVARLGAMIVDSDLVALVSGKT